MKCPNCGQWNKASLPHCFRCGTALPKQPDYLRNVKTDWQQEVEKNQSKKKVYVEVDDLGKQKKLSDHRDELAEEMVVFQERKRRGEKEQKRLREQSVQRGLTPSSRTLRRNINRDNFFAIDDDPSTTLRPRPEELVESKTFLSSDTYLSFTAEYDAKELASSNEKGYISPYKEDHHQQELYATTTILEDTSQLYDGFDDTFAYEPLWQEAQRKGNYNTTTTFTGKKIPSTRLGFRKFLRFFLIALLVSAVALTVYSSITIFNQRRAEQKAAVAPVIMASLVNDQAAHTIRIPGEEGNEIYIKEQKTTYPVVEGIATVVIPDYTWFENLEDKSATSLSVSLSPFVKLPNGDLSPLDPISYTVEVPLTQVTLISPDSLSTTVSKSLYTIELEVEPGTNLFINDEDISDLVNENGRATHNATIHAIGDNRFTIRAKSEYTRENVLNLIIHRDQQEIPLDLSATLPDRTTQERVSISATTLTGANVNVLTPHEDLDVTNLNTDGTFSFTAIFENYGNNTITITSDFQEKKQSLVNYDIVYVPTPEIYTAKNVWPMKPDEYNHFLNNTGSVVKNRQKYLCVGTITSFLNKKPQLAVMNVGTEEKPLEILVENGTRTQWEIGSSYKLYADAYGLYGDIPRLTARYTYDP